jgi:hypothetical protein
MSALEACKSESKIKVFLRGTDRRPPTMVDIALLLLQGEAVREYCKRLRKYVVPQTE